MATITISESLTAPAGSCWGPLMLIRFAVPFPTTLVTAAIGPADAKRPKP